MTLGSHTVHFQGVYHKKNPLVVFRHFPKNWRSWSNWWSNPFVNMLEQTHRIHGTVLFTYIWLIFMVNVSKYTMHGFYMKQISNVCPRDFGVNIFKTYLKPPNHSIVWRYKIWKLNERNKAILGGGKASWFNKNSQIIYFRNPNAWDILEKPTQLHAYLIFMQVNQKHLHAWRTDAYNFRTVEFDKQVRSRRPSKTWVAFHCFFGCRDFRYTAPTPRSQGNLVKVLVLFSIYMMSLVSIAMCLPFKVVWFLSPPVLQSKNAFRNDWWNYHPLPGSIVYSICLWITAGLVPGPCKGPNRTSEPNGGMDRTEQTG